MARVLFLPVTLISALVKMFVEAWICGWALGEFLYDSEAFYDKYLGNR